MEEYGFCRISTPKQNIDRQERNILNVYPKAHIVKETFTGTKMEGRKEWIKLYNCVMEKVAAGQEITIIFDSVSRMSRNAEEGFSLYEELFSKGVNLVFLKEPHINTSTYKKALDNSVSLTGTNVDFILNGVNQYLMELAREQIRIAFGQAEKEVQDLHQRTKEGMRTAQLNGKRVGTPKGSKLTTKKSIVAKAGIKKYNKTFGGSLNDIETIKQVGISRKTFYKYKKELLENS